MQSIAQYNRSKRVWTVVTPAEGDAVIVGGDVFPAGPEGKRAAMLAALANDRHDVAAEVEAIIANHPDNAPLIDRAIRAGQLVAAGNVYAPLPPSSACWFNGECARVESQTTPGEFYAVMEFPDAMWCTCIDHDNGFKRYVLHQDHPERPKHGAPPIEEVGFCCKHILAWLICCGMAEDEPELEEMEIPLERDTALPASEFDNSRLEDFLG